MKTSFYLSLLVVLLCLVFPVLGFAQTTLPGDTQDVAAPIDGGVSLLIAAGVGYGVKKYRDTRKKNKEENNF